jgi:Family of unknown function (DUF5675)
MKIIVKRDIFTPISTTGIMTIDGVFECFTMEPPVKHDGTKPRCIPTGTYPVTIRWSKKFERNMPHIENVSGFDAIEIHWGNFPHDTDGCTLVGTSRSENLIRNSRAAFEVLFDKLETAHVRGEAITITYEDARLMESD